MTKVLSLNEVQKLELDMLIAFDNICKEHELYYTLCGGTLLGAIRHNGFIPWDDDIDVMMPRPYFDKLCDLIRSNAVVLPDHLKIVSMFTEPQLNIPFIKIIDTRTIVSEKYMESDKHLWIDIFVMDGCPNNSLRLKQVFKYQRWLRNLLFTKQTKPGTGKSKLKVFFKGLIRTVLTPISSESLCRKLDKLSRTYDFNLCDYVGCVQWGYGPQERVHKAEWMNSIPVEFEGKTFPAPSNYDEYLTNLYGDYMTLPPLDKRTTHDMQVKLAE